MIFWSNEVEICPYVSGSQAVCDETSARYVRWADKVRYQALRMRAADFLKHVKARGGLCGLCLSFSFGLSDEGKRLLCLGHVPLGCADVMSSHSRIVIPHTLCCVGEIARDVVHRSVRRAQLIHLVFDTWGKADRRHAPT